MKNNQRDNDQRWIKQGLRFSFKWCVLVIPLLSACAPILLAGGAATGYYIGKDQRSFQQIASDATITASINAKYIKDSAVSAININVDTRDGIVTLYGSVPTDVVEERAVKLASEVEGVKKIISKITVVGK